MVSLHCGTDAQAASAGNNNDDWVLAKLQSSSRPNLRLRPSAGGAADRRPLGAASCGARASARAPERSCRLGRSCDSSGRSCSVCSSSWLLLPAGDRHGWWGSGSIGEVGVGQAAACGVLLYANANQIKSDAHILQRWSIVRRKAPDSSMEAAGTDAGQHSTSGRPIAVQTIGSEGYVWDPQGLADAA